MSVYPNWLHNLTVNREEDPELLVSSWVSPRPIVLVTGSFDTRLADVISETQLGSQSEGLNEAFGQSEES